MHIIFKCYRIKNDNKEPPTISETHKAKFKFKAEQHGTLKSNEIGSGPSEE